MVNEAFLSIKMRPPNISSLGAKSTYYDKRHNNLDQYVHWCLAKNTTLTNHTPCWNETMLQPQVNENQTTKIMCEMPVHTRL